MTICPELYQNAKDALPRACPESIVTELAQSWQRDLDDALKDFETYLDAQRTDEGDLGRLTILGGSR